MNEIKLIIGSRNFPGFYESCFSNGDDFVTEDEELQNSLRYELGKKIEVTHEYVDLNGYMSHVSKEYLKTYVEKINDGLNDLMYNSLFEMNEEVIIVRSPQYYNYSTDECFTEVTTNYKTLNEIKKYVLNQKGIKRYIYNKFKRRDGWIPDVSNNIEIWKKEIEQYDINMIIRLLDMFLSFKFEDMECEDIWDYINRITLENCNSKILYAKPELYYNGKIYKI